MTIQAQLADGRVLEFPDGTDPSVVQATVKKVIANPMAAQSTASLESAKSAPFSFGDTARSLGSGVVGGVKSLSDVFGAGSDISKGLGEAQDYLQQGISPERKAEIARRQELQNRAAESGSLFQEAKAFLGGVAEAPIQSLAQAAGSSAPSILAGIAAIPAGAPAALALGVGTIAKLTVGAMQGVGEYKGSVFDAVKAEYIKQGRTPVEAEQLAEAAQQYSREKAFEIGGSAVLGALDAVTGVEPSVGKAMRAVAPTGKLTKEAIEAGIKALPEKALKAPTYGKQILKGIAEEAPLEGAQGAFGQYGENVAMQQAGADVTPMQGVLGAGLRDAAVGALFGGVGSPLGMKSARQDFVTDEFLRQAKTQQEQDKKAADELKKKQETRAKTEESLNVPKMLALPAPAKEPEEERDPLQNPIGNITEKELGSKLAGDIKTYRKDNNLPTLKTYSIEDVKDAIADRSPEEQEGHINRLLASKTNYNNETYTPQNILESALAKNVATETKGWNDFLTRTTGKSDLNTMTQPELHAVSQSLEELKKAGRTGKEAQLVLPEGSNATRFTQDQYATGVTSALLDTTADKPVTYDEALKRVQTQKGVDSDQAADRLLKAAANNDDLVIEKGQAFQAVSKSGKVLGTYATEAEATRNHRRVDIIPVETDLVYPRKEESTEKVAQLPEGYEIKTKTVAGDTGPAAYAIRVEGSQKDESQTFAEEDQAKLRLNNLARSREAKAKAEEAAADRVQQKLEKQQADIVRMEADGLAGTDKHTNAVNKFQADEVTEGEKIKAHYDKAEELRQPLKLVPLGKKTAKVEKHTVIKNGKEIGTFTGDKGKTGRTKAEEHILSQASNEELQKIADRGGVFGKRAELELDSRAKPGIRRATTEGLEKAGVHTPEVEAKLAELKAKLLPMLKKFGLEQVGLNVVRAIENDAEGAWGGLNNLIRIAFNADNPIRTMRHEALHALKDLGFFTPQQWEALKREANKTWVNKYLKSVPFNDTMSRFDAYTAMGLSDEAILEEAIADAFGSWEGGAKPPPGMMAALFKRLQQFFAALRQALTGAGFESADEIFGKIERGELKAGKEAVGTETKASLRNTRKGLMNPSILPKNEKVINDVIDEMGLTPEEFASTSLIHQTGKAGVEQFESEKIGGLPEVVQFLQDQRRMSGLPLLDTEKPEDRKMIAKLMATEAMAAIRSGGANLEWYDSIINKTLAMAGLKYTELNTDINARMAFKIATAITSQGLNVEDNLGFAMKVYDQFRIDKKFPEIGQGADKGVMEKSFALANYLMEDMGPNTLRQFLETEFTAEELRSAGFDVTGELGDEKVLGSSVFGPKIGFGFYSNLNGNFDPVTMDMWFMRTIGRLTGKLKSFKQDLYDAQLKKFRDELDSTGGNGVFASQFDQDEVELAKVDDKAAEALARKVKKAHERDFKVNRAGYDDKTREKSKLVAASETMIKSLDSPKDAPANGAERRNLRDIVRQMVDIVEDKYGKRVPPASLQAVIWYPEQELYKAMGVKLRVTSQNYAGAIEKILTGEGYGKSDLESAAKLGSRTAQQLAKSAVSKGSKATGAQPIRLGALQAGEKEALLERGRKRVVLEEEKATPKRKRVIFEVAPDPNNKPLTDKWRSLSNDQRINISDKIGNEIVKAALAQFGLKGYVDTQVGSYLDDTNPSFALYLDSGDSVAVSKFLGYVLSQDSMMVVSPKEAKGLEKTGAVRINLGEADESRVNDIYQKLREIEVDGEKPIGGQSFMNGHMVVLNYSNVPTDQLAVLINDKLKNNYDVITEDVYTAFPEKKDYDYANPSSDPRGNAGVLRQASRNLRTEATRLLQKELKGIKPEVTPTDQKLSLRQVRDIFDGAEKIPEPPGVEAIREQWIGGVSGVGDRDSMYDLYHVNGSKKYIQDVQDFIRKELGNDFKGYRLMSNDELEELETGSMGSQFVSFTLSPEVAKAFKNIPAYADKTGMSVVEMDLTPEHVAMIGHPGELELVVDYGQGYNPSDIKVVEKYSLKTYFPTAEEAESAAYKKAPPGTAEFKRFFGASKAKEEGRPQVMYHASPNEFDTFRENKPIFVSSDAQWVEDYVIDRGFDAKRVKIYPLWVRAETPFDYENPVHVQNFVPELYQRLNQARLDRYGAKLETTEKELFDQITKGNWGWIETPAAQAILKERGYDSFFVHENKSKNLAVFSASQVKSATGNIGDFSLETKDMRYSLKKVRYSDDRFKKLWNQSFYTQNDAENKTKGYLAFVNPIEFVRATAIPEDYERLLKEKEPLDLERMRNYDGSMYLSVSERDGNWKIIGHEGRHRMLALHDAGYTEVPVYIEFKADNAQSIPVKILRGQFANSLSATLVAREIEPLSYANKNKAMEKYTSMDSKVKYSLPVVPADIDARVNETTQQREHKGFIERILDVFKPESLADLRASFIHRYNQLGVYDRMLAEKMGGKVLMADMSAEAAANMSDLSASVTYAAFGIGNRRGGIPVYKNGMTIVDNSVKGPLEILSPLAQFNDPKAYQHYQFWAGVKRGSRFMAETSPTGVVSYREKNFEPADIEKAERLRKQYKDKGVDFTVIQKEMNTFNDGLVDYMKATGVLAPERAAEFKKHMDYIPFYRQLDGENTVGPKIFNSISGVKPPKKLKGSEAPLTDYLESIVQNTQAAINAGMKNMAAQRAVNVAMQLGKIAGAEKIDGVSSAPDSVTFLENGKAVSYRVADQLFINAVKSLNMAEIPFLGMFSAPSNLLRNLVTKDPGFMLANLARDSLSAWVTSGSNMTPIIGTAANFAKALSGKDPILQALYNAGILGGYEFSSGVMKSAETLEKDLNKKYGSAGAAAPLKVFNGIWDALEKGTEASDAATRMAVYERVLAETGNETEALYRALEVMNFNRKGSSPVVRILTAAIPFLNARVQGLDVFYRTAMGRNVSANAEAMQKAFFVRGATLMALSAAYFLAVSDDDEWKKQEQETKDNYWIAPGIGKFPTPFEVGFLFKTVPERIMAYTLKDDTGQDLMASMQRGLLNTFAFNPIPQIAKPIIEYNANYNFFTGRPIVGQGMEGLEPQYQVGPNTTKTAEVLGKALGMPPIKLDQLINSYTGTMGMYAMTAIDAVLDTQSNSPNASKRFEQLPIVKRFAVDPEARGNITQFYELKKAVDAAVQTQNYLLKSAKPEEYVDFIDKNKGLLAVKPYVSNIEKSMKQTREMRKIIQGAEMSGDEKRDILTELGRREDNLTANIQSVKKMISELQ